MSLPINYDPYVTPVFTPAPRFPTEPRKIIRRVPPKRSWEQALVNYRELTEEPSMALVEQSPTCPTLCDTLVLIEERLRNCNAILDSLVGNEIGPDQKDVLCVRGVAVANRLANQSRGLEERLRQLFILTGEL